MISTYLSKLVGANKKKLIKKLPLSIQYYIGGRKIIAGDIASARLVALKRAKGRCVISGSTEELRGHHLFDVSTYPFWAASPWNFIMITEELHKEFHRFNGGTTKSCTIFHFWYWRYFICQWWIGCGAVLSGAGLVYLFGMGG